MFVSELEKKNKKFYFYFYFFNVIIFNCAHLENFFWLRHYHHLVTSTSSSKPQFGPFLTLSFKKKKKKYPLCRLLEFQYTIWFFQNHCMISHICALTRHPSFGHTLPMCPQACSPAHASYGF